MARLTRWAASVAASAILSSGAVMAAAPPAAAATYLGGIDLWSYCAAKYNEVPGTLSVFTVWPHDAGSWRCQFRDRTGYVWRTVGFDMYAACRWQYGRSDAYARSYDWSNPRSWQCFVG